MNPLFRLPSAAKRWRWQLVGLCGVLLASVSHAQNQPLPPDGAVWLAASDRTLDRLRGGFDLGAGLVVSFGISRAVYINDQLVTTTSFQLGDISKFTPAQAAVLSQQISAQTQVVQNGPGNTVAPGALVIPLATYIQNTLNNQTIRAQTVIQGSTNGLGLLRGLNLQATITEAISNAIQNR